MSMNIADLYQDVILDHNRCPRNCYKMENADRKANGYNPLCGDKVCVFVKIEENTVKEASFCGAGCAISTASASLLTEQVIGKTIEEANAIFKAFHAMVTEDNVEASDNLGKLKVLAGVKQYPARVKCATLAWHTFQAAIENTQQAVTTE